MSCNLEWEEARRWESLWRPGRGELWVYSPVCKVAPVILHGVVSPEERVVVYPFASALVTGVHEHLTVDETY